MIHVKAFGVGLVSALLAATLWISVAFVLPIVGPMLLARLRNEGGAVSAGIGSGSILLASLLGFLIGYVWTIRRRRKPAIAR
jgi:hypothetical protein